MSGYGPNQNSNGAAWVFVEKDGIWSQQGRRLEGSNPVGPFGNSGYRAAISGDGNTLLVGSAVDANGAGAAYIFERTPLGWVQQGKKLTGPPGFGAAVALSADGNTALIRRTRLRQFERRVSAGLRRSHRLHAEPP